MEIRKFNFYFKTSGVMPIRLVKWLGVRYNEITQEYSISAIVDDRVEAKCYQFKIVSDGEDCDAVKYATYIGSISRYDIMYHIFAEEIDGEKEHNVDWHYNESKFGSCFTLKNENYLDEPGMKEKLRKEGSIYENKKTYNIHGSINDCWDAFRKNFT